MFGRLAAGKLPSVRKAAGSGPPRAASIPFATLTWLTVAESGNAAANEDAPTLRNTSCASCVRTGSGANAVSTTEPKAPLMVFAVRMVKVWACASGAVAITCTVPPVGVAVPPTLTRLAPGGAIVVARMLPGLNVRLPLTCSAPIAPGKPPCNVPPLLMNVPLAVPTVPVPASVLPAFTVSVLVRARFPVTASVPLSTVAVATADVPPKVQSPEACTSSVVKLTKLLLAVPVPCSTSAVVAPAAVLPAAVPFNTEPVCKVSTLAPVPRNLTESSFPVMVPALITVPAAPLTRTPSTAPMIVPPAWLVTLPPAPRKTPKRYLPVRVPVLVTVPAAPLTLTPS